MYEDGEYARARAKRSVPKTLQIQPGYESDAVSLKPPEQQSIDNQ